MDPILDLQCVRAGLYTYSLRVPGQAPLFLNDYVGAVDECLADAAAGLQNYFDRVQLQVEGRSYGTVEIAQLSTPDLAQKLTRIHARVTQPAAAMWRRQQSGLLPA